MRNYELRTQLRALLHLPLYHLTFSFLAFALFLARLQSRRLGLGPPRLGPVLLHWLIFACVAWKLAALGQSLQANLAGWLVVLGLFAGSWAAAILPLRRWPGWLAENGPWLSAAAFLGAVSLGVVEASNWLWKPLAGGTMGIAMFFLGAIYDDARVSYADYQLGTSRFYVTIEPGCSGYEGIGLILVFGLIYLWLRRQQLRFPLALWLLPLGCLINWLINGLRIAALVVLGSNFSADLAMKGFHSQAGWLTFILTSAGLVLSVEEGGLFQDRPPDDRATGDYPAAPYLMPLLALLLGSMLGAAFSTGFPLLYPVRIGLALLALAAFNYSGWLSRPNWPRALGVGLAVYVVWALLVPGRQADTVWPLLSPALAWGWVLVRVLGSSIVVPMVEELAFRAYLQRRLQSEDFESVSPQATGWAALLGSSLLFGLLHQDMLAAVLAGLAYGALYRQGGLSECVLAHGLTNLCICIQVLAFNQWSLWS
ncbi:MAG: exosortase E/protease, VPEID-CTERM system [Vulcanimicrobiota bacterium]